MKKYIKLLILPILVFVTMIIILITNVPRLEYKYSDDYNGYLVTKAIGNAESYSIKDNYNNKAVVGIAESAFKNHNNLKKINLPDSIKFIGRMAFYDCNNLEEINLNNVIEIERNAFSYCEKIEKIELNALYIGASAFYKCNNLKEIILNDTESIGDMAFSNTKIKTINIPYDCTYLGDGSFNNCFLLETINVYGPNLKNNTYLKSLAIVNYISKE